MNKTLTLTIFVLTLILCNIPLLYSGPMPGGSNGLFLSSLIFSLPLLGWIFVGSSLALKFNMNKVASGVFGLVVGVAVYSAWVMMVVAKYGMMINF